MPGRILMKKPDLKLLNIEGYNSVDMHFHSKHSDGSSSINQVLRKAKHKHIGVAVTDHNSISGSLDALGKAKEKGVMVIPGMEVAVHEGPHLLFYFYSPSDMTEFYERYVKDFVKYKAGRSLVSIAKYFDLANDYNCVMSVAHPGQKWMSNLFRCLQTYNLKELFTKIYALEVINGICPQVSNLQSIFTARNLNTRFTGGSDGHSAFALGSVVTSAFADNAAQFLESIHDRQNDVIGRQVNTFAKKVLYGSGSITHNLKEMGKLWRPSTQLDFAKFLKLQISSYMKNGKR